MDKHIVAPKKAAKIRAAGVVTRMTQLTSAIVAVRMLLGGRLLIEEIAAEIGLGRRSAYRVLDALEALGIPIQRSPEGRHVYLSVRREDVERALGL